ncbi:hypothetical protein NG796_19960 [Laspinema sp. A4]|nr:hypothetical protein [Laspinema sp. D2d]
MGKAKHPGQSWAQGRSPSPRQNHYPGISGMGYDAMANANSPTPAEHKSSWLKTLVFL